MLSAREVEQNEQLRRADWRFLLRLTEEPTSICLGSSRLAAIVASVSALVELGSHEHPIDLAVVANPTRRSLARAWRALRPGGGLYVESLRPYFSRARLRRRVASTGFVDVSCYMPWPWPSSGPRLWLPLDVPDADRLLTASGPPGSWRESIARVLWRISRRLGIVLPVHVVAHKPGRNDPDIADFSPDPRTLLLLTGGQRSTSKVVALVFGDAGTKPQLLVKFSRGASGDAALGHEHEILQALERTRPGLDGVPRALFVTRRCGRLGIGETAFDGAPLMSQLNRTNHGELAAHVTDWLVELAGTGRPEPRAEWSDRLIETVLREFESHFGGVSGDDVARTRWALSLVGDLPLVPEHRDCSPWNILVGEGGRLGVLDWESSEPRGLPGLDLVYFLTYSSLVVEDAFALPAARQAYARTRDPSTTTGAVVADCERRYAERLGLEAADLAPLRLLCWLVHSRSEYRRLEEDVAGTPRPDALADSLFLAFWREELRAVAGDR